MEKSHVYSIETEKLIDSVTTLSSIEDWLNTTDLSIIIIEIEQLLQKLNFEHGNCFLQYKKSLDDIIEDISDVQKEISELNNAIDKTTKKYQKVDQLDSHDITDISTSFKNQKLNSLKENIERESIQFRQKLEKNLMSDIENGISTQTDNANITKIPPVENENSTTVIDPVTEQPPTQINTIPIGLGIAATGIAGSIGAVVLNELNGNKGGQIEEYKEETDSIAEPTADAYPPVIQPDLENYSPYQAARNKEILRKFYGDDTNKE